MTFLDPHELVRPDATIRYWTGGDATGPTGWDTGFLATGTTATPPSRPTPTPGNPPAPGPMPAGRSRG
jgi:hypothetical protein